MKPADDQVDGENSIESEEKEEEPHDLDVRCMNCGDYIFIHEIESHSLVCVQVLESEMDSEDNEFVVQDKIVKLGYGLEKLMPHFRKAGDRNYLNILMRLCKKLHTVFKTKDLRVNHQVEESLASLLTTFKGSETLKLYGERLKALTREQQREFALKSKQAKDQMLKRQVDFYKLRIDGLERSLDMAVGKVRKPSVVVIDNPDSNVGSKENSLDISISSGISGNSDLSSSYHSSFDRASVPSTSGSQPDAKRTFYSKCLTLKLGLPRKSKANSIPISQLYRKATQQSVAVEDYDEFILKHLQAENDVSVVKGFEMTTLLEDMREEEV